mmetsp:Transcript_11697/g.25112  ORF Transcript_11697/g.25112 Transcript_11697/m.25112 type:complete len:202 (-) Transcript_11697:30-635(-)
MGRFSSARIGGGCGGRMSSISLTRRQINGARWESSLNVMSCLVLKPLAAPTALSASRGRDWRRRKASCSGLSSNRLASCSKKPTLVALSASRRTMPKPMPTASSCDAVITSTSSLLERLRSESARWRCAPLRACPSLVAVCGAAGGRRSSWSQHMSSVRIGSWLTKHGTSHLYATSARTELSSSTRELICSTTGSCTRTSC